MSRFICQSTLRLWCFDEGMHSAIQWWKHDIESNLYLSCIIFFKGGFSDARCLCL
jgi:hypothetical protein